jgi:hypothetical protein
MLQSNLDYLRLATWDDKSALNLFADLRRWATGWKTSRWLQYKGHRSGGMFYGTGEQSEKRHYVADCSGPDSQYLYGLAGDNPKIYCTRIDLQITIPQPDEYEPFTAYAELKAASETSTSFIHSDTGSTIYIGARTGQRFARLYEKRLGDDKYLRLEFEVKGRLANVVFLQLRNGIDRDTIYNHFLIKSKAPDYIKSWFETGGDGNVYLQAERQHDADKQLEWLASLENTVLRMGNDHYQGPTVKGLLERWIDTISK